MKFGARLREARERSGLTLPEIAVRTRISRTHLDALERDEISKLPGGIFSRAFVRAYAEQVGLDPERAVEEFLASFSEDRLTVGRAHTEIEDNQAIESQRRAAETVVKLLIVSVPLAIAVIYFTVGAGDPRSSTPLRVAAAPLEARADPGPSPVQPAVSPTVHDDALEADAHGLTVALRATRDCWVSATADGAPAMARVVTRGEAPLLVAQEELQLTVGDAGAVSLVINGEAMPLLGGNGQVVTLRLTPANYRTVLSGR